MRLTSLLKSLGPGLLWAGAAIGVSHLVQSTRAGATFGFDLVLIILLINLFKYPFFEFGPRYATATGESLLDGYRKLGKWAIILYFILTILTMFTLQGAVTIVTAGIFANTFPNFLNSFQWTILILAVGTIVVVVGKYKALDKIIKFIIVILAISTIIAVISASAKGYNPNPEFATDFTLNLGNIALLIAFAGWMPSAIDISVWHSYWSLAKVKSSGYKPKLKESLFDFNVGYIGTAILSIGFLSLGALVMHGSGEEFSSSGATFAGQLIGLFTSNIGAWSYPLIAVAALTTMSSTTLTCLDAYPRVMKPATEHVFEKLKNGATNNWLYVVWMVILLSGTLILLKFFTQSMAFLVDLATTLSFLTAPLLGYLNYKVVTAKWVAPENRPPRWLQGLSVIGLVVLSATGIGYMVWKFVV